MMKIHTTQDLSALVGQQQFSTNCVSLSELGFSRKKSKADDFQSGNPTAHEQQRKDKNYKTTNTAILLSGGLVITGLCVALSRKNKAGKKLALSDFKNTVKVAKEQVKVGDIKETPTPEMRRGDKFLNSKFFDKLLKFSENEPVMQATMSALICIILRPLTIMGLPNKKQREDNMYASAHSMSSGVMGLISTALIAQPFKAGSKYAMDNMKKEMSEDALKRLWPNLDIESIYTDATHKARNAVEKWKFKDGNKFIDSFKDVEKIPVLLGFNDISAETYRTILNADVDWASQKGKSFNDVITKDGSKLYDVINWKRLGIIVEPEYIGADKLSKKMKKNCPPKAKVLLQDLDREFLEKIIKDADADSIWKKLDINSVYKDGKVVDFRNWKEIGTDKQWKLDLDNTYISSPFDTNKRIPRISGCSRIEPTGEIKNAAYLKNGVDGALGTKVDEDMAAVDKKNEVFGKVLTWAPDVITRPLVATATISLIPIVLKKVFHMEKGKKPETVQEQQNITQENDLNTPVQEANNATTFKGLSKNNISVKETSDDFQENNANVSFKGKSSSGSSSEGGNAIQRFFEKIFVKPLAKIYGKRMYESERVNRVAWRLTKIPGSMTNHMATLGALLTSSVYMYQTLHKKNLEDDRKRTLAVNQGLCFVIPTICAYTVDKLLNDWTKKYIEYRYCDLKEGQIEKMKLDPKQLAEATNLEKNLGQRLKGVRILISLAVFSMIYRYIAPVLITPLANRIGDKINENKKAKALAETTPTIAMNNQDDKLVAKSA